jgi:glycerol-3-phosphate dehydrogenase
MSDTASLDPQSFDIAVVGGGINGAGIACDAAGRGLKVILAEMGDLASATSSASSKLIHGGLRYLEHYEFRLVRHALAEREVLMAKAPHIIWPMRFVLPHVPGLRPRWMIRAGLAMYDNLYRRKDIPGSRSVDLTRDPAGQPLAPNLTSGFSYYDCWVDDSRLVLLNAQAAVAKGAEVLTRTRVTGIVKDGRAWRVTLMSGNTERVITARTVVNAAGPWADKIDGLTAGAIVSGKPAAHVRLVKGSHIVLPRVPGTGEDAYLMQNADGRVVFVLPFEEKFTIIGTTDVAYEGDPGKVTISADEERYLLDLAQKSFKVPLKAADIVWRYSGVRPLYDDGDDDPSAVTRDYTLELKGGHNDPARLSVYGGKVTTYRCLAEDALDKLQPFLPHMGKPWTKTGALPGGDIPGGDFQALLNGLTSRFPHMDRLHLQRLARRHGTRTAEVLGDARALADLGRHFGEGLTEREVLWMKANEWARSSDDVLWRRSKLGLHMLTSQGERERAETAEAIDRLL